MNEVTLHEELLEIISNKYSITIKELLGFEGLGIIPYPSTFTPKIRISLDELNQIFYTIEFLEREHYAVFDNPKKNNLDHMPSIVGLRWKETPDIDNLEFIEKLFEKYYNKKITVTTKFFEFRNNNQKEEHADNSAISYKFNNSSFQGILKIGDIFRINFKGLTAYLINFFYITKELGNDYRSYREFNEFIDSQKIYPDTLTSDDFSKKIKSINKRVEGKTDKLIMEIIIKGKNKKIEANIYKWNKK